MAAFRIGLIPKPSKTQAVYDKSLEPVECSGTQLAFQPCMKRECLHGLFLKLPSNWYWSGYIPISCWKLYPPSAFLHNKHQAQLISLPAMPAFDRNNTRTGLQLAPWLVLTSPPLDVKNNEFRPGIGLFWSCFCTSNWRNGVPLRQWQWESGCSFGFDLPISGYCPWRHCQRILPRRLLFLIPNPHLICESIHSYYQFGAFN